MGNTTVLWLSPILGALTAIFVTWCIRGVIALRQWRQRPKLTIYLGPKELTYPTAPMSDRDRREGRWIGVMVRNEGVRTAQSCMVKLIQIHRKEGDDFIQIPQCPPDFLPWGNEGENQFDPKDVERDLPVRVGLCLTDPATPKKIEFLLRGRKIPSGRITAFHGGVFRVVLRAYMSGLFADEKVFIIDNETCLGEPSIEPGKQQASVGAASRNSYKQLFAILILWFISLLLCLYRRLRNDHK